MKALFLALAATMVTLTIPAAAMAPAALKTTLIQEKQYKKIAVSAISKQAMDAIKKGYGNYTVKEAYQAADGEYKLVLNKDGIDTTATFTAEGEMIKILN